MDLQFFSFFITLVTDVFVAERNLCYHFVLLLITCNESSGIAVYILFALVTHDNTEAGSSCLLLHSVCFNVVLGRVLQTDRTNRMHMETEVYSKKFAHTVMEADSSGHAGHPGEPMRIVPARVYSRRRWMDDGRPSVNTVRQRERVLIPPCILFRPKMEWMRPTDTGEDNLLSSVHGFKCQSLQKHPPPQTHPE